MLNQKSKYTSQISPKHRNDASFSLSNKLFRVLWQLVWLGLARTTPPQLHAWRSLVLRLFGAKIGANVRVYPTCRIWHPANLVMLNGSVMGRGVNCYNQGTITIGERVTISQDTTLCASTHDINDALFPLLLRPIYIENDAWIAAEAFVGPGVTVGEGAVLGARAVAMQNLTPWTFYSGNPATPLKQRTPPLFSKTPNLNP